MHITAQGPRLRNDLYCVEWDVKLYTIPYHTIPTPRTRRADRDTTPPPPNVKACNYIFARGKSKISARSLSNLAHTIWPRGIPVWDWFCVHSVKGQGHSVW